MIFQQLILNSATPSAAYMSVNRVSIGSDNGLPPIQHQAINWTNTWPIGPLGTNFSVILIKIQNVSFTKRHLKISSAKWLPFYPGGDELIHGWSWFCLIKAESGEWLNIKMTSYQYIMNSHYEDKIVQGLNRDSNYKMVSWRPPYLHRGNPYTWKHGLYVEKTQCAFLPLVHGPSAWGTTVIMETYIPEKMLFILEQASVGFSACFLGSWPEFNTILFGQDLFDLYWKRMKMPSYRHMNSHYKDQMVSPSYIYIANPHSWKDVFILKHVPGLIWCKRCHLTSIGISIIKVRLSLDCLIFISEAPSLSVFSCMFLGPSARG